MGVAVSDGRIAGSNVDRLTGAGANKICARFLKDSVTSYKSLQISDQ